jgi:hypothetical protein
MTFRAALAAAASAVAVAAAGCGGDDSRAGRSVALVWKRPPELFVPPTLPRDRILRGEVSNGGLDKVRIESRDVKLLDARGRPVDGVATFAPGYVHSLYSRNRLPPGGYPEAEQRRIGRVVELKPGQDAPLTVSWHEPRGPRRPVKIDYGSGSLEIP